MIIEVTNERGEFMEIIKLNEYDIDGKIEISLQNLLIESFPDVYPHKRIYFKQIPHFRYLAYDQEALIAQVGLDYRVMNLNSSPIKVLGIIDLCVKKKYRGKNVASILLNKIDAFSKIHNLDFLLLFADIETVYLRNGFIKAKNICRWLKIDEYKTLGIGEEEIEELMIKKIGCKDWEDGYLDMLGYLY
jgi:GNAT superfamily N-acetyltransferase